MGNGFMRQRVLIIDDSPQIHRLVEAWLKSDSVELAAAPTGAAGHTMAVTWQPDLILLDVDLPDQSGFDLCRALKSDEACCKVPIVFLTGASSPEDRVTGLNLGAVDYIVKPFHPAEFQARVQAALRTKYLLDLLQQRAQIDGLTGLRNRSFLDERLATERAMIRRYQRPLACIMIDVDHFKAVNDLYGHATGDEVLRCVADVLTRTTRLEDVVARYGGEEFTILTPGVDVDGAMILAERIRVAIENLNISRGATVLRVTCSFGVAGYDPEQPDTLIPQADTALYAAKSGGRNRVELFAPAQTEVPKVRAA
jgi:diguanylate cyclase (GGDEF)-like protein